MPSSEVATVSMGVSVHPSQGLNVRFFATDAKSAGWEILRHEGKTEMALAPVCEHRIFRSNHTSNIFS